MSVNAMQVTLKLLLMRQPVCALLIKRSIIRYDLNVNTSGVRMLADGVPEFVFNPKYFFSLTQNHKIGLLWHQCLHLLGNQFYKAQHLNKEIANIALDLYVNQFIDEQFLPPEALLPQDFKLEEGLSFEQYYKAIALFSADADLEPYQNYLPHQQVPKDFGYSDKSYDAKKTNQELIEEILEQNSYDDVNNEFNFREMVLDHHQIWDDPEYFGDGKGTSGDDASTSLQKVIGESVAEAMRTYGEDSIPNELKEMINQALDKPKLNWRNQLKNFTGRKLTYKKEKSRKRAHRKLGLQDMGMVNGEGPEVRFAVDCSASVSDEDYLMVMPEINAIMKEYPEKLEMIFFDTVVFEKKIKMNQIRNIPERPLRGGTNFQCVIDYLNDEREKPDLLMFLTDGEAPAPKNVHARSVIWLIPEYHEYNKNYYRDLSQLGKIIFLDGNHFDG